MKCTKNYRLSYTKRAQEIVNNLTLEQKVHLMSGTMTLEEMLNDLKEGNHYNYVPYPAGGIEEVGLPPVLFVDGPRGVVCGTGKSTCFPVSMLRGATFDVDLEERIGRAIGKEVRAYGGNLFAGVCINLPYNPGWGRSQETYGEESFHLGQMGSALVRGVQEENVIACVKHYAFNSMEISRFKVSVDCDKRTEREVFLPHFKDCVDAGAACIMSAYNRYKGTQCGHHDYLLNQVLKGEWDFDGFVMSDFIWGVRDTVEAANGGQDMEMCCTQYFGDKLVDAVRRGDVPEEKINQAALRIVRTILAFTEADNNTYDESVTPLQGIAKVAKDVEVIFYDGTDMDHAKKLAADADYTLFVVGFDHNDEGEYVSESQTDAYTEAMGGDRKDTLGLHKEDIELIKNVGPVNKNSVVALIGGNMIMIDEWKDCVSSILMAYYPGMEGGTALAEILFGDVNPSGKLPFVIPAKESDLPQVNWDTDYQYYEYYHGYAKLEKEGIKPSVPYGFGLSYTTFEVSDPVFSADNDNVIASCKVKNTGNMDGAEVIQLYVGFKNSSVDRPVKLLRGFKRVELKKGEEKAITIKTPIEKLKWFNEKTNSWELEHMDYEVYIGTSSDNNDLLAGKINL